MISKDAGHGIHHPVYGVKMKERCDAIGMECHLLIKGVSQSDRYSSPNEFIAEVLGVD